MSVDEILAASKAKSDNLNSEAKTLIFKNLGLGHDGIGHVAFVSVGDEDYEGRIDELKRSGFRYNGLLKVWIRTAPAPDTTRIDFNEHIEFGFDKRYHLKSTARYDIAMKLTEKIRENSTTGFVGKVGERITVDVEFSGGAVIPSDSDFGDLQILNFTTKSGDRISWLQRNYSIETIRIFMKTMKAKSIRLTGTVKRHSTKFGTKLTDVSRCEISANGHDLHSFSCALKKAS